jgi:hypothetical protein
MNNTPSLNVKDWLAAYDAFLAEQAAQREKEPKREVWTML